MMLHVKVVQLEFQDLGAKTAPAPGKDSRSNSTPAQRSLNAAGGKEIKTTYDISLDSQISLLPFL
jgi:hypothetical protein